MSNYQQRKQQLSKIITIYGRNAVHEALLDSSLSIYRLHLADSNKPAAVIQQCLNIAKNRHIEILYHNKRQLSFISKNAKQDQGIALDVHVKNFNTLPHISAEKQPYLLLLDNITNPQNIGMIIRSAAAGNIDGIIIPEKGCAELGPLVIKSSAGAIFKAPIIRCQHAIEAIEALNTDYEVISLSLQAKKDFFQLALKKPSIFVLGNETNGVSQQVEEACNTFCKIPMNNHIESLNVAVTASLIAFHPSLRLA